MIRLKAIFVVCFVLMLLVTASGQNVEYVNSVLWTRLHDVKVVYDYAYCVFQNGLIILDVSNPETPELVNKIYLEGEAYSGDNFNITLYSYYALIAKGYAGLQIVDIVDPENITSFSVTGSASGIDMMDHYAIVVGSDGLYVIDVETPTAPQLVGQWGATGGDDVVVSGDYAYVTRYWGVPWSGLYVYDLSDPTSPNLVGSYECPNVTYDIFIQDNFAYIAEGAFGLLILDIRDPANPIPAGFYNTPAYVRDVFVVDSLAYLADFWSLEIINIDNPSNPSWVGSFSGSNLPLEVFVSNNKCYLADHIGGLSIVDVTDPANPILAGEYVEVNEGIWGVNVHNGYLYTGNFYVFDITDPAQPVLSGNCPIENTVFDIMVQNDIAYAAAGYLVIIDVADPTNPNIISSYQPDSYSRGVYVADDYVYLASCRDGLDIIDVSNPEEPVSVGHYQIGPFDNRSVVVRRNLAFLAYGIIGLVIVDISDPSNPGFVGGCPTDFFAWDVHLYGHYVCVSSGANFQFIDITDPSNPVEVSTFPMQGQSRAMYCEDGYAYLADENLVILDISDITNPTQVAGYQTPGTMLGVTKTDEYIYAVDGYSVVILRVTETGIVEEVGRIPVDFTLSQNYPNPFNAKTTISYELPQLSDVAIDIYDVLGRKVETLLSVKQQPGKHSVIWDAETVSSGVYYYKIEADEFVQTKKMLFLK